MRVLRPSDAWVVAVVTCSLKCHVCFKQCVRKDKSCTLSHSFNGRRSIDFTDNFHCDIKRNMEHIIYKTLFIFNLLSKCSSDFESGGWRWQGIDSPLNFSRFCKRNVLLFSVLHRKTEEAGLNGYISDLYLGDDPFECQTEPRVYRREISWFLFIPVSKFSCGTWISPERYHPAQLLKFDCIVWANGCGVK